MFLGEFPPLPPEMIRNLHTGTLDVEMRLSDKAWEMISQGLMEGWGIA